VLDTPGDIPEIVGCMTAAASANQELAVALTTRNPPRSKQAFGSAGDYAQ
jgi:hypothetical protein